MSNTAIARTVRTDKGIQVATMYSDHAVGAEGVATLRRVGRLIGGGVREPEWLEPLAEGLIRVWGNSPMSQTRRAMARRMEAGS